MFGQHSLFFRKFKVTYVYPPTVAFSLSIAAILGWLWSRYSNHLFPFPNTVGAGMIIAILSVLVLQQTISGLQFFLDNRYISRCWSSEWGFRFFFFDQLVTLVGSFILFFALYFIRKRFVVSASPQ